MYSIFLHMIMCKKVCIRIGFRVLNLFSFLQMIMCKKLCMYTGFRVFYLLNSWPCPVVPPIGVPPGGRGFFYPVHTPDGAPCPCIRFLCMIMCKKNEYTESYVHAYFLTHDHV